MANPLAKLVGGGAPVTGRSGKRMEFEIALELGDTRNRSVAEVIRQAADSVGGDLLFVLPAPDGVGVTAVVRLLDGGRNRFLEVRTAEGGFAISEDGEIAEGLLGLAKASIDVLERLRADRRVLAPLSETIS